MNNFLNACSEIHRSLDGIRVGDRVTIRSGISVEPINLIAAKGVPFGFEGRIWKCKSDFVLLDKKELDDFYAIKFEPEKNAALKRKMTYPSQAIYKPRKK